MALTSARKKEILETVSHLRVTDVRDGMDWVGRHHFGTVSPEIRPLWRTKAAGFAVTARHIPTQQQVPTMSPQDYTKWAYEYWYGQVFDNDFGDQIDDTSFLVIDTCNTPTPAVGSMDSMVWAALGARGCLTNGGARDTDETLESIAQRLGCSLSTVKRHLRRERAAQRSTTEVGTGRRTLPTLAQVMSAAAQVVGPLRAHLRRAA